MNETICNKCNKRVASGGRKRCDHCRMIGSSYARRKYAATGGVESFCAIRREKSRARRRREKQTLLDKLGGKCACCEEATYEFLTIDHIDRDGAKHRRELKINHNNMGAFCGKVLRSGNLDGLQILCSNCHLAKDMFGGCPHELQRRIDATVSLISNGKVNWMTKDEIIIGALAILTGETSRVGPKWKSNRK